MTSLSVEADVPNDTPLSLGTPWLPRPLQPPPPLGPPPPLQPPPPEDPPPDFEESDVLAPAVDEVRVVLDGVIEAIVKRATQPEDKAGEVRAVIESVVEAVTAFAAQRDDKTDEVRAVVDGVIEAVVKRATQPEDKTGEVRAVIESVAEAVIDRATQSVVDPAAEPATEPEAELDAGSTAELEAEPAAEPATEPATEPAAELEAEFEAELEAGSAAAEAPVRPGSAKSFDSGDSSVGVVTDEEEEDPGLEPPPDPEAEEVLPPPAAAESAAATPPVPPVRDGVQIECLVRASTRSLVARSWKRRVVVVSGSWVGLFRSTRDVDQYSRGASDRLMRKQLRLDPGLESSKVKAKQYRLHVDGADSSAPHGNLFVFSLLRPGVLGRKVTWIKFASADKHTMLFLRGHLDSARHAGSQAAAPPVGDSTDQAPSPAAAFATLADGSGGGGAAASPGS